jgi:uncharacterized protein (DUF302 family)
MSEFALSKELSSSFERALAALPGALGSEGFGVLTQIDVAGVFDQKLGKPFRKYTILGACNPALAHRALSANLLAGVMIPCNVMVWERDDGRAAVAAVDPLQTAAAAGDPVIGELARDVRSRLDRVLGKLE